MPRFKQLFASGFGYIAFLIAQIYGMVRLIPADHPYQNPQNIGLFGVRHVIAVAANNLEFKKQNIDQFVIFGAILAALVLLIMQFLMIIIAFLFNPASAQIIAEGPSIFVTPNINGDIAFMLLDQVFGIPGLYQSCIATSTVCPGALSTTTPAFPYPFHIALHEMFRFYSTALLVIGALIFLYFIVVIVLETATTGTPFGQRFQNIWAPVRLVVALGLLVPINYGMNSGQYITLYAAKYGSSLATNGWIRYNNTIAANSLFAGGGANPTGEKESLIAFPNVPSVAPILQTMSLVHACAFAYWIADNEIEASDPMPPDSGFYIQPYLVKQPADWMTNMDRRLPLVAGTPYSDAVEFYNFSDIVIRFGRDGDVDGDGAPDDDAASNQKGYIVPLCGDVRISARDFTSFATGGAPLGAEEVQEFYFDLIKNLWFGGGGTSELVEFAQRYGALKINANAAGLSGCDLGNASAFLTTGAACTAAAGPTGDWKQGVVEQYQSQVEANLISIWENYISNNTDIEITAEILERGWGGAGIWFNKISQLNGAFADSFQNIPHFDQYPQVMEKVREERRKQDPLVSALEQFEPNLSENQAIPIQDELLTIASLLNDVFKYWNKEAQDQTTQDGLLTGSGLEDGINIIFGTEALFNMTDENNHVHPLAQLAMLGKGLVEASIRNVAASTVTSGVGGLARAFGNIPAQLGDSFGSFILSTAFIGLTAGIVLYYIVPFLPFVYFYFAVSGWVKSIFEAMVGVPLWALAHLRLDGEGLPGNSASNGYFLILEIFLRPILSVFGLVASIVIFTAQVRVLNFIWQLVTENLAGFNGDPTIGVAGKFTFQRSIIDEFFFTVIYAIIVYMMAIAAFKLVDKIPDNILRWTGAGVSSFSDINQDPTEGLTKYAALGGLTAGREIAGGVSELGKGIGGNIGNAAAAARGNVP